MKDIMETVNEAVKRGWSPGQLRKLAKGNRSTVKVNSKWELIGEIQEAIKSDGNEADLNYIDVSSISDFTGLFYDQFREFNGDISEWDMSNAVDCSRMFAFSMYTGENGDLTDWNMKSLVYAQQMFYRSKFDGDISTWSLPSLDKKNSAQFMGGAVLAKTRKHWPKIFR